MPKKKSQGKEARARWVGCSSFDCAGNDLEVHERNEALLFRWYACRVVLVFIMAVEMLARNMM